MSTDQPPCIFCSIINDEAPADGMLNYGTGVSFLPLNPVTPGHRLFVPTFHFSDMGRNPSQAGKAVEAAAAYGAQAGGDYNVIISAGPAATQTVFHLHVHYVPRHHGDGLYLPWTGQVTA